MAKDINRPPILFDRTQELIGAIEKHCGTPLFTYWNSSNGGVCHNDASVTYEILGKLELEGPLSVFIKSDGGRGTAALRIVNSMRHHASRITALVPLECTSAATMMALGSEEIRMGPLGHLSAVDTSLTHDLSPIDKDNDRVSVSQNELTRIVNAWRDEASDSDANPYASIFQHIHPLVIGAVDRASSLSIRLCREILSYHMEDEAKIEAISRELNEGYPSHAYPITLREAQRLGLNAKAIDPELDRLLIELNAVYSEMGQRALTDYNETSYHDHEIKNILEGRGLMICFQADKDWHYRPEERRWTSTNDESGWRRVERVRGKVRETPFHLR